MKFVCADCMQLGCKTKRVQNVALAIKVFRN